MHEYDFVIVGAGAAGCVLARRLSEDPAVSVLVLEAGGPDSSPLIHTPLAVGKVWNNPRFNWGFRSDPEPHLDGRCLAHPRGKVLGGSSSINMMTYVRGDRRDFDRWSGIGAPGWGFDDLLPYFRRSEDFDGHGAACRGRDGPLKVSRSVARDAIYDAFMRAGREMGCPVQADYNEAEQDGFSRTQFMVRGGRRSSAASAYLRPAMRRANVTVETGCQATRIDFEGARAVGVRYLRRGRAARVRAAREVLLCGGAFGSPHLLMLSGIGPADTLEDAGIAPRIDLAGVGRNLRDHPQINLTFAAKGPTAMRRQLRADRLAASLLRNACLGTGFAAEPPAGVTAFIRSEPALDLPDIQLFCLPMSPGAGPWLTPFAAPAEEVIVLKAALLRPESAGRLWPASADPAAPPGLVMNFLGAPADRASMRNAVRFCRALAATDAFRQVAGAEIAPGAGVQDDAGIDAFVRAGVETIFHPCGTCRMGTGADAVTDGELRVRGTESLRVIDASVMPDHIGATINAAVVAIAERASDLITGKAPPPGAAEPDMARTKERMGQA